MSDTLNRICDKYMDTQKYLSKEFNERLLSNIHNEVYFGRLKKEQIDKVVNKALNDRLQDEVCKLNK